jgi:DNA-binding NtrC family response regulator
MTRPRVLIVDDKESVLELLATLLGGRYEVATTPDPARALARLEEAWDVVLTDVRMPGASGFDVLAAARRCPSDPSVVLFTGFANIPDAVEAMRQGAFDYVSKPLDADDVGLVVARAVASRAERLRGAGGLAGEFRGAVDAARDRASRDYLVALMRQFQGNVTRAERQAGLTRESLHRVLRKYGLRPEDYRREQA